MDNRAQLIYDSLPVVTFIISVLIAVTVGFVVVDEVKKAEFQESAEDLEHVCNGFFGCDGYQTDEIVSLAAPFVLAVVWVLVSWLRGPHQEVSDE